MDCENLYELGDNVDNVYALEGNSDFNFSESFHEEAITSAKFYYRHLKKTKQGREEYKVLSIKSLGNNMFSLGLDRKIVGTDSVSISIQRPGIPSNFFENGIEYETDKFIFYKYIKILKNVSFPPALVVSVSNDFLSYFNELKPIDIVIVSDLTFLIKNVEKWYRKFGLSILYPPLPNLAESDMVFRGYESECQILAEKIALTSPLSYIWGAPGTGKTQTVLSNCIMSYIKKKQVVYVVAPTNNAIEQVLRATIKALTDSGQSIDCLYRRGISSDDFAHDYPEVCERLGQQKRIDDIKAYIALLNDQLAEALKASAKTKAKYDFDSLYIDYLDAERKLKELKTSKESIYKSKLAKQNDAASKKSYFSIILNEIKNIEKQERSFGTRIKSIFGSSDKETLQAKRQELKAKADTLFEDIKRDEAALSDIELSLSDICDRLNTSENTVKSIVSKIKKVTIEIFNEFVSVEESESLFLGLVYDSVDIDRILKDINDSQSKLASILNEQESRLDGKLVIAFTIDYLIAHYEDLVRDDLGQVFLDEGAYCPLIKSGVLFSLCAPVTILGDHMQLPPICEVNPEYLKDKSNNLFLWAESAVGICQIFEPNMSIDTLHNRFSKNEPISFMMASKANLDRSFRFGNNLAHILDRFVYKNGFSGNENRDTEIIAIDAKSPSGRGIARTSESEADCITNYVKTEGLQNFAVLTPYRDQVKLLKSKLKSNDNVMTIHRSQGREWDTVIISVVDSINNMFFMDSENKRINGVKIINTAISRAKKRIVIVCDYNNWASLSETQLIGNLVSSGNHYTETQNI